MQKTKIVIVEDNELFRTSLSIALEKDFEIMASCSNGQQCLDLIEENAPDLIILDIGMPIINGLEVCKLVKDNHEHCKVVIFSVYSDEQSVFKALQAKADAYCTKDTEFEKLIEIIHNVMNGAIWLDPSVASYVHSFVTRNDGSKNIEKFHISERELEVLELLVEGKSNKEIATQLFITVNTAKAHVCSIMNKLSAKSRTDAAVKASKQGLI